ncbi:MAG: ribosome small subunit-dependent GTPase A [Clostridiales bacterium]|jgi:ribosome biogenesis GTPase|nr:ribosome small subunit-dependent GTPase A [Clostridiales bacterium]
MNIKDYGWNEFFEYEWKKYIAREMFPGRIIADYGQIVRLVTNDGEVQVGRPVAKNEEFIQMAVGDWVVLQYLKETGTHQIYSVLPRKTKFSRAAAGIEVKEQIVAANVDIVFLIQSLNKDFNMKRLERYMITAWESGAKPVVVLTKSDCCDNVEDKLSIVYATIPGVDVHAISCLTGEGIPDIRKYLAPGKTIALLGSSGVGKSTLLNYLAGVELLKTGEIREDDDKGRHTTSHRELFLLSDGSLILDTPGMRSLLPWEADVGMEAMFGDIEVLVTKCRFFDCKHMGEPGCAVRESLNNGSLEIKRWESWTKLQKEMTNFENRKRMKQKIKEKQWIKQMSGSKKTRQKIDIYQGMD